MSVQGNSSESRNKENSAMEQSKTGAKICFNPFGRHEAAVNRLKENMETFSKIMFVAGKRENALKLLKIAKTDTADLCVSLPTSMTCVLTTLIPVFTEICKKMEEKAKKEEKIGDYAKLFGEIIARMGSSSNGPFTSQLLAELYPLLEILFISVNSNQRHTGATFWKRTFANVDGCLNYPGNSKQVLQTAAKAFSFHLPRHDSSLDTGASSATIDEEAMDGMTDSGLSAAKNVSSEGYSAFHQDSSTFQLSQQPFVNELASKLQTERAKHLEQNQKTPVKPVKSELLTPIRSTSVNTSRPSTVSKPSKHSFLNEDSCDYVVITTPTSQKKTHLTERQKEKLQESNIGINYLNEESQTGFQKEASLKKAFTKLNYEIDESSNTAKSQSETIIKVEPEVDTDDENGQKKTEKTDPTTEVSKTPQQTETVDELIAGSEFDSVEDDSKLRTMPDFDKMENSGKSDSKKKDFAAVDSGNIIETSGRGRRSLKKAVTPKKYISKKEKTPKEEKSDKKGAVKENKEIEKKECNNTTNEPETVETKVEADNKTKVSDEKPDEQGIYSSPSSSSSSPKSSQKMLPLLPSTPSILRKRSSDSTPMTDRKRNRVHFDADSLPEYGVMTPKSAKSSEKKRIKRIEETPETENIVAVKQEIVIEPMEMFGMTIDASTPFYPQLINCSDPIKNIARNLTHLSTKASESILISQLRAVGVSTVGQFASLSSGVISNISGIRKPKTATARNSLINYEKIIKEKNRMRMKYEEEEQNKDKTEDTPIETTKIETVAISPIDLVKAHKVVDDQSVPMDVQEPANDIVANEPANYVVANNIEPCIDGSTQIEECKTNVKQPTDFSGMEIDMQTKDSFSSEFIKDCTQIHEICDRFLLDMHSDVSNEKWNTVLGTISKAYVVLRGIVLERGNKVDWDEDMEQSQQVSRDRELNFTEDGRALQRCISRVNRHHSLNDVSNEEWSKVMYILNDAASSFESIVREKTRKNN